MDLIQFNLISRVLELNFREPITLSKEIQDLEDVAQWARNQGYSKVITIGFSLGGLATLLANIPERITAIFWSPAFYFIRSLKKMVGPLYGILNRHLHKSKKILKLSYEIAKYSAIWVNYTFVDEFEELNLDSILQNFTTSSIIIQGAKDSVAPANWTREAFEHMPQDEHHQLIELPKLKNCE